jgi:hypothetical protein
MNKIALIPIYKSLENNKIFNYSDESHNAYEPMEKLKMFFEQKNFSLNTIDINMINDSDLFIFFRLEFKLLIKLFFKGKLKKSIYIPLEPEIIDDFHTIKKMRLISNFFGKILTWNDDAIDNKKFFKCYLAMPYQHKNYVKEFNEKKLITNISGFKSSNKKNELYSERLKTIKFLEKKYIDSFDLYGRGWDGKRYPSYKGAIDDKLEVLSKYKFSLCYENMTNCRGYVTEKIFDCFYANTVPIYWGATNIQDYIPKECFIDRRNFDTNEELMNFVLNVNKNEYEKMILAINNFLISDTYKNYLSSSFANTLYNHLTSFNTKTYSNFDAFLSLVKFGLYLLIIKIKHKLYIISYK